MEFFSASIHQTFVKAMKANPLSCLIFFAVVFSCAGAAFLSAIPAFANQEPPSIELRIDERIFKDSVSGFWEVKLKSLLEAQIQQTVHDSKVNQLVHHLEFQFSNLYDGLKLSKMPGGGVRMHLAAYVGAIMLPWGSPLSGRVKVSGPVAVDGELRVVGRALVLVQPRVTFKLGLNCGSWLANRACDLVRDSFNRVQSNERQSLSENLKDTVIAKNLSILKAVPGTSVQIEASWVSLDYIAPNCPTPPVQTGQAYEVLNSGWVRFKIGLRGLTNSAVSVL